jgi:serine/threonine protein kinase
LQSRGLSHGDYRPSQILLDDENNQGIVRLTDNGLIGLYRNNYILTLSGAAKGYLSPELIAAYSRREPNPAYDVYRADVYSLGMTLLQCASLREPEKYYYEWSVPSVAHKSIRKALDDLRSQYSPQLVDLISTMLEENEQIRPDFLSLGVSVKKKKKKNFNEIIII